MAEFEYSPKSEAGAELYTFGDAFRQRKMTPKDFASACGISVARAGRLLKGGFIPNDLDLDALAQLLGYDSRTVITLRERHNQRHQRLKDRATAWSVPLDDGFERETASKADPFNRRNRDRLLPVIAELLGDRECRGPRFAAIARFDLAHWWKLISTAEANGLSMPA